MRGRGGALARAYCGGCWWQCWCCLCCFCASALLFLQFPQLGSWRWHGWQWRGSFMTPIPAVFLCFHGWCSPPDTRSLCLRMCVSVCAYVSESCVCRSLSFSVCLACVSVSLCLLLWWRFFAVCAGAPNLPLSLFLCCFVCSSFAKTLKLGSHQTCPKKESTRLSQTSSRGCCRLRPSHHPHRLRHH